MKLASSPGKELLDHHFLGPVAEPPGEHLLRGCDGRLPRSSAMTTPLPAASPLAFTTIGAPLAPDVLRIESLAGEGRIARGWNAVPAQKFLGERLGAFQLRRAPTRAEALQAGGGELDPRCRRPTAPRDRRWSDRSFSARASATSPAMSSAATFALRTFGSVAVPALPGATITSVTRAEAAHFQAKRVLAAARSDDRELSSAARTLTFSGGSGACR